MEVPLPLQLQGLSAEEEQLILALSAQARLQYASFKSWSNYWLQDAKGAPMIELAVSISAATPLVALLEALSAKTITGTNSDPANNVNTALKFMSDDEGISTANIQPEDILAKKLDSTLGLLWLLVSHYQISYFGCEGKDPPTDPREAFLAHFNKILGSLTQVANFSSSFQDGLALCNLVEAQAPGLIDTKSLDPSNRVSNMTIVMDTLHREWNVPIVFDSASFVQTDPDEKAVMAYLALCLTAFERKKNAAASVLRRRQTPPPPPSSTAPPPAAAPVPPPSSAPPPPKPPPPPKRIIVAPRTDLKSVGVKIAEEKERERRESEKRSEEERQRREREARAAEKRVLDQKLAKQHKMEEERKARERREMERLQQTKKPSPPNLRAPSTTSGDNLQGASDPPSPPPMTSEVEVTQRPPSPPPPVVGGEDTPAPPPPSLPPPALPSFDAAPPEAPTPLVQDDASAPVEPEGEEAKPVIQIPKLSPVSPRPPINIVLPTIETTELENLLAANSKESSSGTTLRTQEQATDNSAEAQVNEKPDEPNALPSLAPPNDEALQIPNIRISLPHDNSNTTQARTVIGTPCLQCTADNNGTSCTQTYPCKSCKEIGKDCLYQCSNCIKAGTAALCDGKAPCVCCVQEGWQESCLPPLQELMTVRSLPFFVNCCNVCRKLGIGEKCNREAPCNACEKEGLSTNCGYSCGHCVREGRGGTCNGRYPCASCLLAGKEDCGPLTMTPEEAFARQKAIELEEARQEKKKRRRSSGWVTRTMMKLRSDSVTEKKEKKDKKDDSKKKKKEKEEKVKKEKAEKAADKIEKKKKKKMLDWNSLLEKERERERKKTLKKEAGILTALEVELEKQRSLEEEWEKQNAITAEKQTEKLRAAEDVRLRQQETLRLRKERRKSSPIRSMGTLAAVPRFLKDERVPKQIQRPPPQERNRAAEMQIATYSTSQADSNCGECSRPVMQGFKALGKNFHKEHFRCAFCIRVLFDGRYWEKDKVPCCESCSSVNTDLCTICSKKIDEDSYTAAMAKAWHRTCFRCVRAGCHAVLDEKFYVVDSMPYCSACVQKMVEAQGH